MTTRTWLMLLLTAALAVRVGWCFSRAVDERAMAQSLPDQWEYVQIGRHVFAGEGFSFFDFRFQQRVYAFRTPGYPVLIALCGGTVRAVQMVQCVLDTSTVLAAYLLARRWLSASAALLAAAAVGFNPFLIFFCSLILTESLFTAVLTWSLALLVIGAASRRTALFWCGVFLAATMGLIRPSALALAPLLVFAAAWAGHRSFARGAVTGLASIAVTVLVMLPWAARNRSVLNEWIWTATNSGFTLYDGFNPAADGSSDQSFVARLPQLAAMNETQRNRYLTSEAVEWARSHPSRSFELAAVKLARTWSPFPLSDEFGRLRYVVVGLAYSLPLFVLTVAGLFLTRLTARQKLLLLLPAIYFSVSHALSVGSLRYRIPAEPALAVIAASVFCRRTAEPDDAST